MPAPRRKPQDKDAPDEKPGAAADAAVAEVANEDADAPDVIDVEHAGIKFSLSRRRLESVQFRRLMQRGRDIMALEWLLTSTTVDDLLRAMADADGVTAEDDFQKIFQTIGEAVGAGN